MIGMNIKIRFASLEDVAAYTDLLQYTYEHAYTNPRLGLTKECFSKEIFATNNTQDYLKSHLLNNDSQKTWLVFDDKRLVGAITCIIKNDVEAELTGFYVHPDYQGHGIGKRLYNLALEFGGKRDFVLDIYAHNVKTIAIYQKWGWELDVIQGDNGYFFRHWDEWPANLQAKSMYMRLIRRR